MTPPPKANEIIALLPSLTQKQLHALHAAVGTLLMLSEKEDGTWPLFNALTQLLGYEKASFKAFKRTKAYKQWRQHAESVVKFVDDTWPETSKVGKHALLTFLLELVRDDLIKRKIPISITSIVINLGRSRQFFEGAFPAYLQSGLAHLILEHMLNGGKNE